MIELLRSLIPGHHKQSEIEPELTPEDLLTYLSNNPDNPNNGHIIHKTLLALLKSDNTIDAFRALLRRLSTNDLFNQIKLLQNSDGGVWTSDGFKMIGIKGILTTRFKEVWLNDGKDQEASKQFAERVNTLFPNSITYDLKTGTLSFIVQEASSEEQPKQSP